MLEWLGMTSVGVDVTISVNWDGAMPEDHPMFGLTDQLFKLTDVLYSVFLGIDDTASGPLVGHPDLPEQPRRPVGDHVRRHRLQWGAGRDGPAWPPAAA